MTAPIATDLADVGPFAHLDDASRNVVARWFQVETFDSGEIVVHEDDGKAFFVIASGSASISLDGEQIGSLGTGDYFGEMSLLYSQHRVGTVTATSPITVWSMFGTRRELPVPA